MSRPDTAQEESTGKAAGWRAGLVLFSERRIMTWLRKVSPGRLIAIVWLFTAIVLGVLAMSYHGMNVVAAGRAYVGGESLWSKAQKNIVYHLARYTRYRDEDDWREYEAAIDIIQGDRAARLELEKAHPDLSVARRGFIRGGNHPADVDNMIWLFRAFRTNQHVDRAIQYWTQADAHIDELSTVARRIRAAVQDEKANGVETQAALAEIHRLNDLLTPLERGFSESLSEAQRESTRQLITVMFAAAAILLAAALLISYRIVRNHEAAQRALTESEGRLRQLLQTAPMPLLISVPREQRILYANDLARQFLNITGPLPVAFPLPAHYEDAAQRSRMLEILERDGTLKDFEVKLLDAKGNSFWALVSAQKIEWGGQQCAFVAFNDIDERKRLQEDMQFRAYHDDLTDLPNRSMFMEQLGRTLARAQRTQEPFSLLFIDMDRFKEVNDTLGHAVGDSLLQAVSDRLMTAVRESDLVARLGGDEFVVLVDESRDGVARVAQTLIRTLCRPYEVADREVSLTASIGIASFPANGGDVATLVKNADIAMYQAKEHGRNNYQFYAAALDTLSLQRLDFETRLRNALDNGEFTLMYQPVVNLQTGRIIALEALLRWQDPELGLTLPGKFMPFAEESGVIVPIGQWALTRACLDLATWRREPDLQNLRVAVNLSARQFLNDELSADVELALAMAGVPPQALELEITETAVMRDLTRTSRILSSLKRRGTSVAIDDFGTGHSSLGQMKKLPADTLKIDKSFVDDCAESAQSATILRAVVMMAHSLGLGVVAEGVEQESQLRVLAGLGCDLAQGWYFSGAVPAEDVPELVRKGQWSLGNERPELRAV